MRGPRVYKEWGGVLYDTYIASRVFCAGRALIPQYLAVTPEGHFFVVMPSTNLPPHRSFHGPDGMPYNSQSSTRHPTESCNILE